MSSDPFDLLGMPARFDLDRGELRAAYLARSGATHPDLARGDAEAAGRLAALNEAKRVLEDPESRADALLRRLGGPTRQQERSLPAGFLAEMMEIREAMASAAGAADSEQAGRWERWAEDRRGESISRVSRMFAGVGRPARAEELRAIRGELNVWRYIERMVEQLDPGRGGQ